MSDTLQYTQLLTEKFLITDRTVNRKGGMKLVNGLHKLMQKVVLYLASDPGSVYSLPIVGSNKVRQLKAVTLSDATLAEQLIAGLQSDIERWLNSFPSSLPPEEQLGKLKLSVDEIGEDSLVIGVAITSRAGSSGIYPYALSTTAT